MSASNFQYWCIPTALFTSKQSWSVCATFFGKVSHLLRANHYKYRTIPNTRRGFYFPRNILAKM